MKISKENRLKLIKDKIFLSLSEEELVFLRNYIHKHGYESLYDCLGFDLVSVLKKI